MIFKIKYATVFCILFLTMCCAAQVALPSASPSATPAVVAASSPVPSPTPSVVQSVPVAEPAAPPKWAEELIMTVQKFPIVGPLVSKVLVYMGILSAILTSFIAFLLTALSALGGAMNLAGLASIAAKIQMFKDGKIMYWLKYLSMFNAQKPEEKPSA